ncbi:hypothetical protein C8R44DRAFT_820226 [Mycena epipterygia]|nr:hypothetical protein C8R44DRAFT_820226 [Mycena epipterygia]
MRFLFPSRVKKKPPPTKTAKSTSFTSHDIPDVLRTSLMALKESSDAFPPLKSAVGGVVALLDIAERAKHSKSSARAIALRTKEILDVIADAVPEASAIPPPMLQSIQRFTALLDDIRCRIEAIAVTGGVSRVIRLNRNEHALQDINAQLDDAYRDFVAASLLRGEVTHSSTQKAVSKICLETTHISTQLSHTQRAIAKSSAETSHLSTQLSHAVFYSRLTVFLVHP